MESQAVPMSYREKSAWVTLVVSLVVYGLYFGGTVYVGPDPQLGASLGLFFGTVFALVVGMIVVHIVIAITTPQERKDERDAAVELLSYRNAYWALVWSPWFTLPAALSWAAASSRTAVGPFVLVGHALFLCLVLSEVTKLATQVVMYRRRG
jgi:hypothetical protein